jgi:VIT1/CCC1 family predicted Fe2+/Mn2+ transporter
MNKHTPIRSRFHRNSADLSGKTNWLKAGVLGSNDGIISISGLVIGVASATDSKTAVLTAGLAGIAAGALSIAVGEYLSVSIQRDSENTLLAGEKRELRIHPKEELNDLVSVYVSEGLSVKEAEVVARELTKANALAAHADVDYHLDTKHLTSPWASVFASAGSFIVGAFIPLIFIMLPTKEYTVQVAFISVIIALIVTGIISAKMSGVGIIKPTLRVVIGGAAAMTITYMLGNLIRLAGA